MDKRPLVHRGASLLVLLAVEPGRVGTMTSIQPHRWAIYRDPAGLDLVRTGTAASVTNAWMAALAAGHAVLLNGTTTDLAVAVDDEVPTVLYSPARDESGRLDPAAVTRALVEIYQGQTAALVAEQLAHR